MKHIYTINTNIYKRKGKMVKLKRKVYRVSASSLAIVIPAAIVEAYGIDIGDKLEMDLNAILKPSGIVEVG